MVLDCITRRMRKLVATKTDLIKHPGIPSYSRSLCERPLSALCVPGAPEPPADRPNHSEVTATSVTLSWYGPTYDGGSVVTGYNVEARKVGQDEWKTLITG